MFPSLSIANEFPIFKKYSYESTQLTEPNLPAKIKIAFSLFDSNLAEEEKLIDSLKSLINSDSLWKPHALLLLGDYFFSKKELSKSKDFYSQILQLENLPNNLYNHSQSQLIIIENE